MYMWWHAGGGGVTTAEKEMVVLYLLYWSSWKVCVFIAWVCGCYVFVKKYYHLAKNMWACRFCSLNAFQYSTDITFQTSSRPKAHMTSDWRLTSHTLNTWRTARDLALPRPRCPSASISLASLSLASTTQSPNTKRQCRGYVASQERWGGNCNVKVLMKQ